MKAIIGWKRMMKFLCMVGPLASVMEHLGIGDWHSCEESGDVGFAQGISFSEPTLNFPHSFPRGLQPATSIYAGFQYPQSPHTFSV